MIGNNGMNILNYFYNRHPFGPSDSSPSLELLPYPHHFTDPPSGFEGMNRFFKGIEFFFGYPTYRDLVIQQAKRKKSV